MVIYKSPGIVVVGEDVAAWKDLAARLPDEWEQVARRREPQVLLLLRTTYDETILRVDAFVTGQNRVGANFTRLPGHIAVSPTLGQVVTFLVDEIEGDVGIEVSAEGFRCEIAEGRDANLILVLCYPEAQ
jgi:hypothetical protein